MKSKLVKRGRFQVIFIISWLTLFSFNAYGGMPVINDTKLEGGLRLEVKFKFNSAKLTPASHRYLDKLAKDLESPQWADERFIIEGHSDTIGDEQYNLSLSEKRAEGVKAYLVDKHKIDPDRITVKGYGESMLLDSSETIKANRINRRVIMRHVGGIVSRLTVTNYGVAAVLVVIFSLLGRRLSRSIFRRV